MTKKNSSKMQLKSSHEGPSTENQKPSLKPKKKISKMPLKNSHESPCTENQKPSLKPKKMGSEIDEIFAAKKRKGPENDEKKASTNEKPRKVSSSANVKSNGKMRMVRDDGKIRMVRDGKKSRSFNENESVGPTSRPRKKTADGLTLYTEEELGFGKSDAGGTPLCPFDCDCCF